MLIALSQELIFVPFLITYYFEITIDSQEVAKIKNSTETSPIYTRHQVCPSGYMAYNYDTLKTRTLRLLQHVHSSVPFCRLCRLV